VFIPAVRQQQVLRKKRRRRSGGGKNRREEIIEGVGEKRIEGLREKYNK
jgi:hypothetical protein